jgi:hypothetical protein
VLAQLAGEVDVDQSFREAPRAVHLREAIVVAACENDLQRERCGCLKDGEIRSRRRAGARFVDLHAEIGGQVLGARTAVMELDHAKGGAHCGGAAGRGAARHAIATVDEQLRDSLEVAGVDPLGICVDEPGDGVAIGHRYVLILDTRRRLSYRREGVTVEGGRESRPGSETGSSGKSTRTGSRVLGVVDDVDGPGRAMVTGIDQ